MPLPPIFQYILPGLFFLVLNLGLVFLGEIDPVFDLLSLVKGKEQLSASVTDRQGQYLPICHEMIGYLKCPYKVQTSFSFSYEGLPTVGSVSAITTWNQNASIQIEVPNGFPRLAKPVGTIFTKKGQRKWLIQYLVFGLLALPGTLFYLYWLSSRPWQRASRQSSVTPEFGVPQNGRFSRPRLDNFYEERDEQLRNGAVFIGICVFVIVVLFGVLFFLIASRRMG